MVLQELPTKVSDRESAIKASAENLRYMIRIALTNHLFYTPLPSASDQSSEKDLMILARRNVSRLLRHLDYFQQLPQQESGILMSTLRFTIMPYIPEDETSKNTVNKQANDILQIVSDTISCFTTFIARFGPCISISLPVICIGLSTLSSGPAKRLMRHINRFASPFDTERYPIRFAIGESRLAGQIWNYVRVPPGCSISSADIDAVTPEGTAGTLGPYVYDKTDLTTRYAITAGHVAPSTQTAESILAPASKPYREAIKSMEAGIVQKGKAGNLEGKRVHEEKLEGLRNLDRSLGTVVFSSTCTSTVAPHIKEDIALLKVKANRAANNNLEHGPGYNDYAWCTSNASYPKRTAVVTVGSKVAKFGVRTGYTEGLVVQPAYVRWERDKTRTYEPDNPAYHTVPASLCHTIMSTSTPFADQGDSGSLVVAARNDDSGQTERVDAIGIVYAIYYEDIREAILAYHYPIDEVLKKLKMETGLDLVLDERDHGNTSAWPYVVMGGGRSMYGLH
jgi:hypothetical protein